MFALESSFSQTHHQPQPPSSIQSSAKFGNPLNTHPTSDSQITVGEYGWWLNGAKVNPDGCGTMDPVCE